MKKISILVSIMLLSVSLNANEIQEDVELLKTAMSKLIQKINYLEKQNIEILKLLAKNNNQQENIENLTKKINQLENSVIEQINYNNNVLNSKDKNTDEKNIIEETLKLNANKKYIENKKQELTELEKQEKRILENITRELEEEKERKLNKIKESDKNSEIVMPSIKKENNITEEKDKLEKNENIKIVKIKKSNNRLILKNNLKVFKEPDINSKTISTLNKGNKIYIIEENDNWCRIQLGFIDCNETVEVFEKK